jgi:hypothetical protein
MPQGEVNQRRTDGESGRRPIWPVLAGILVPLSLLGLYVGAYFALTRPVRYYATVALSPGVPRSMTFLMVSVHDDDWSRRLHQFFAPMEAVDRQLRPKVWETRW